jgi:hypothetical protein
VCPLAVDFIPLIAILLGAALALLSIEATGNLIAPGVPLSRSVRFTTGAAVFSLLVFCLLSLGLSYWPVYAALPVLLVYRGGRAHACRVETPLDASAKCLFTLIAALYLIYALAPETQPDAAGYHLRLVANYAAQHAFPTQSTFYNVLPQGMEMLFLPAFLFGAGSAAKLVHFAFLLLTIPLAQELACEAGLTKTQGSAAAAIFLLAPVCAVAGTSAYTDAGLVCASAAVILLLLHWTRERRLILLVCAALNAGFCYAVKPTFGWVALAAVVFVAFRERRVRPVLVFACAVLVCVMPWMIRAWILSGSPAAPFLSHALPNRVLTPELEKHLMNQYSAFRPGFEASRAWLSYTILGGNQGVFGPAFLLLPLALFRRRNLWLPVCMLLLAAPILLNTGARFLMPAMLLAAIGIVAALPRRAAFVLVAVQAIAVPFLHSDWQLGKPPLAAALRIEPEATYLRRSIPTYAAAEMLTLSTPAGARILACTALPEAYVGRDLLPWWHSRQAEDLADALHFASMSQGTRARLVSLRWRADQYRSMRITPISELRVVDATLSRPGAQSWRMRKPGETINFFAPPGTNGADVLIWPGDQALETTEVLPPSGAWRTPECLTERRDFNLDVRRDATAFIRRSGYAYIAVPVADDAFATIGIDMVRHSSEWGVTIAGEAKGIYLLHIESALL